MRERRARIALRAVHQELEMQMRTSREARLPDVRDRLADRDRLSRANAGRESAQMPVARDESVPVADLHEIPIAAALAGERHRAVADRAHRRARVGRIVDARVLPPD